MYFVCGACLKVENKDPEHFSNIAIPPSRSTISESRNERAYFHIFYIFLDNNYVEFLQMLLAKHSQDKYKVTER